MKNLAVSLEKFIRAASKNKLWVFGWSVFVAALYWTVSFYTAMPGEIAGFDQYAVELERISLDNEKALQTTSVISDTLAATLDLTRFYSDTMSGREFGDLPADVLWKGLLIAKQARTTNAVSIGYLKGVDFYSPDLAVYKDGFEQDLRAMDSKLELYENFYAFALSGEKEQAATQILQVNDPVLYETFSALETRITDFTNVFLNTRSASIVKTEEKTKNVRLYWYKMVLSYAAIAYIGGFLVFAAVKWRRSAVPYRKPIKRRKR